MNSEENQNEKKVRESQIGDNTIAYGNFPNGLKAGNNSIIIGPTHGTNTIINGGTAIGHGAFAGENGIAIGHGAGSGNNFVFLMAEMRRLANESEDSEVIAAFSNFENEINKEQPNKANLEKFVSVLKNLATLNGLIGLGQKIAEVLPYIGIG